MPTAGEARLRNPHFQPMSNTWKTHTRVPQITTRFRENLNRSVPGNIHLLTDGGDASPRRNGGLYAVDGNPRGQRRRISSSGMCYGLSRNDRCRSLTSLKENCLLSPSRIPSPIDADRCVNSRSRSRKNSYGSSCGSLNYCSDSEMAWTDTDPWGTDVESPMSDNGRNVLVCIDANDEETRRRSGGIPGRNACRTSVKRRTEGVSTFRRELDKIMDRSRPSEYDFIPSNCGPILDPFTSPKRRKNPSIGSSMCSSESGSIDNCGRKGNHRDNCKFCKDVKKTEVYVYGVSKCTTGHVNGKSPDPSPRSKRKAVGIGDVASASSLTRDYFMNKNCDKTGTKPFVRSCCLGVKDNSVERSRSCSPRPRKTCNSKNEKSSFERNGNVVISTKNDDDSNPVKKNNFKINSNRSSLPSQNNKEKSGICVEGARLNRKEMAEQKNIDDRATSVASLEETSFKDVPSEDEMPSGVFSDDDDMPSAVFTEQISSEKECDIPKNKKNDSISLLEDLKSVEEAQISELNNLEVEKISPDPQKTIHDDTLMQKSSTNSNLVSDSNDVSDSEEKRTEMLESGESTDSGTLTEVLQERSRSNCVSHAVDLFREIPDDEENPITPMITRPSVLEIKPRLNESPPKSGDNNERNPFAGRRRQVLPPSTLAFSPPSPISTRGRGLPLSPLSPNCFLSQSLSDAEAGLGAHSVSCSSNVAAFVYRSRENRSPSTRNTPVGSVPATPVTTPGDYKTRSFRKGTANLQEENIIVEEEKPAPILQSGRVASFDGETTDPVASSFTTMHFVTKRTPPKAALQSPTRPFVPGPLVVRRIPLSPGSPGGFLQLPTGFPAPEIIQETGFPSPHSNPTSNSVDNVNLGAEVSILDN